ncbi:MAG: peroxiredoxin [Gammaproteobacteria bacterium]|nr:peroxiredoxin [Gammaproteobacteria bacterium]
MLRPGDTAPDFSLPDSAGQARSLESLLSPDGLVLFFYPGDFTPVCTREACMIRDLRPELETRGRAVVGVSPDDSDTHRRFRERYALEYPLLSDPEKRVISLYGAAGPFGLVRRTTYLIGPDRKILDAARADLRLGPHARLLRRLQP